MENDQSPSTPLWPRLWKGGPRVLLYGWVFLDVIGSAVGWLSGASIEDAKGSFVVLRTFFGETTGLATGIRVVLFIAAVLLAVSDVSKNWRYVKNWLSASVTRPLGDPLVHASRYYVVCGIGVLAMVATGISASRSLHSHTFLWSLLGGLIACVSIYLLATVLKASPSHEDVKGLEQERNSARQNSRDAQTANREASKQLERLRSELIARDNRLKYLLKEHHSKGLEKLKEWRNNEITIENTGEFLNLLETAVFSAILTHTDSGIQKWISQSAKDIKVPLDIIEDEERAGFYRKWQSYLNSLEQRANELPRTY